MSITHWDPLDELTWLRETFDIVADELLGSAGRSGSSMPPWVPLVEAFETAGEIVVRATMPGIDPQTLRVDVAWDRVALRGEARREPDQRGRRYHRRELRYGIFRRVVLLPAGVDPATAKATYRHGLLEVRMSKAPRIKPFEVNVEVG